MYCSNMSELIVDKKKRAPNFSAREKSLLLNTVYSFKNIIENKKTNAQSWKEKDEAWEKVTKAFNSQTVEGYPRSKESLRKYYDNIKKMVRRDVANERKELHETGGGPNDQPPDDPTRELALGLMNEKTVFGLHNPYDGDSSCMTKATPGQQSAQNSSRSITTESGNGNQSYCSRINDIPIIIINENVSVDEEDEASTSTQPNTPGIIIKETPYIKIINEEASTSTQTQTQVSKFIKHTHA